MPRVAVARPLAVSDSLRGMGVEVREPILETESAPLPI